MISKTDLFNCLAGTVLLRDDICEKEPLLMAVVLRLRADGEAKLADQADTVHQCIACLTRAVDTLLEGLLDYWSQGGQGKDKGPHPPPGPN